MSRAHCFNSIDGFVADTERRIPGELASHHAFTLEQPGNASRA
jgi:hypothetical protein